MLDDDDNMSLPSRYYLRQRMSELPAAELVNLLSSDDVIARTVAGMCLHLAGGTREPHDADPDVRRGAEESVAYLAQHPSSECHERTATRRTK
ncbi:hypothetical protein [Luteibacter sp.]|uniref:hypothetical protein n=1 Tax=Luteibacter sp. TaxID=1886636 RepID=UPI003F8229F3